MNLQQKYHQIYQQQQNNRFCQFKNYSNGGKTCGELCFNKFCPTHVLYFQRQKFVKETTLKPIVNPIISPAGDNGGYMFIED